MLRIALFGKELAEFNGRIETGLSSAKKFQDELLAEADGGVPFSRRFHLRVQRAFALRNGLPEPAIVLTNHGAILSGQFLAARHDFQKLIGKMRVVAAVA